MNVALNYIVEANIGLILFLVCYKLLLGTETSFRLIRMVLLAGIFASLIFPLIHIGTAEESSPLSIGAVIPSYWLPEVVVGDETATTDDGAAVHFWNYTSTVYWAGMAIVSALVFIQLIHLIRVIRRSRTYRLRRLRIAESSDDRPTFSFFNFIFIGRAHHLSSAEKQQIIRHESVHARQWHSLDMLLVNALRIAFWFNPIIGIYRKIFIQLHEFEADARAVENSDVNTYCSLLAKVALESADFRLASHFNQSLTVKRIEMMRTIKSQIKRWKLAALAAVLPSMFFFVACQDQIGDDVVEITKNSSHALIIPDFIQQRFEALKKEHPNKNYAVLQLNEKATEKMQELQSLYGLPASMEVFKTVDGKMVEGGKVGEPSNLIAEKTATESGDSEIQTFAIVEFNAEVARASDAAAQDKIFTVVQESPEYSGGYDAMMAFIRNNLRYPTSARQQGIEGTVYVSFIVEKDGHVDDVHIIRGISPEADLEAARVVGLFPNWIPGKQNQEVVRVRFVLPIKFRLTADSEKTSGAIEERHAGN